jgi:diacylglycerol O-acyltransferase / wax synthase
MSATEERLSSLDSTFLELEQADEGAMMHIGGALVFDPRTDAGGTGGTAGTPTLEELLGMLEDRSQLMPRHRSRLSEARVHGLRRPSWVEDPTFDVRAHVRHATLPAPGTAAQLHEWLADFWSHRLDRARPLWEMTLVDGLEGGCWMLATKTHHALVDGVGSVDLGHLLLDAEPHPTRRPQAASTNGNGAHSALAKNGSGPHLPDWIPPAARVARAAIDAALHPKQLIKAGEAAVAMGEMVWQDEVMAARHSSLNVPIGTTRRFASVVFDLAEIKEIKRGLGGTVNDVVLAIATGALRRLLHDRGERLEQPLRAMVPVNLRGDQHDGTGNRVTSLFVELPVGERQRPRRYERTCEAAARLKGGNAALGGTTLVQFTSMAPPLLHEQIAKTLFAPRLFNITITNVPGPQFPLYALGSRLRRIMPLVPLFADHAIGIAIVSYDGQLVFGINADYAANPDLDILETGLREEFARLLELAGD